MRELRKETETKLFNPFFNFIYVLIRNERTPKGDGNLFISFNCSKLQFVIIRNERTPKGDGNIVHYK